MAGDLGKLIEDTPPIDPNHNVTFSFTPEVWTMVDRLMTHFGEDLGQLTIRAYKTLEVLTDKSATVIYKKEVTNE